MSNSSMLRSRIAVSLLAILIALPQPIVCAADAEAKSPAPPAAPGGEPIAVSGIYPHLAMFNKQGECGVGAVVPWAGRLWVITYPPHMPKGSPDKLYAIGPHLTQDIRPESVGGTHANRLIHRESNQLIIGPYFIDESGKVRVADIEKLVGRLTGTARHLTDPANKVYFYDMEGAVYEVDVKGLAVTKLFDRAAPGAHGKGAYTGQGRFIISNNGDAGPNKKPPTAADPNPKDPEAAGALAEWDGKAWTVIERRQFTDITGPGGIYGAPDDKSPVWALGWDKRSVILKLLDDGKWSTFRLPKATHTYDPKHGWYTEWPRIREVKPKSANSPRRLMMDMHGMFYDFPEAFSQSNTAGIAPIASHLRYVPDFCDWNGRLVLASDDTSIMQNPMAGQSQSNLWFGKMDDLKQFGPASGWGGVWLRDPVKAGQPSEPYLIAGFDRRIVHLYHDAPSGSVKFTFEIDANGDGKWTAAGSATVPAKEYGYHVFPRELSAQWVRVTADRDCNATAYFHYTQAPRPGLADAAMFGSLSDISDAAGSYALIRPAAHNRNLQVVAGTRTADGQGTPLAYLEVNEGLQFDRPAEARIEEVTGVASIKADFEVDDASVVMTQDAKRYRLPKGHPAFDKSAGELRGIREVASERYLMNVHGTFYEIPREKGLPLIKPVASHSKRITDFCTWRGLLVMSGCKLAQPGGKGPGPDGHTFASNDGTCALWFGSIDDLWRLGAPRGTGGPLKSTAVKAGQPSDPYLMTGYNRKRVELSHDSDQPVAFRLAVDVDHTGWRHYQTITVPPGKTVTHEFPEGFSAHWARATLDKDCKATAWFVYEP